MVEKANDGDRLRVRGTCRGPVNIRADIVISGRGERPTLTGRHLTHVVHVHERAAVTIRNLTIKDGRGEGIYSEGKLIVTDSTIRGNRMPLDEGSAAGVTGERRTVLRRVVFVENAEGQGGTIFNFGRMWLIDSVIRDGRAR
jgi:hypothetical protein